MEIVGIVILFASFHRFIARDYRQPTPRGML
jgi:hypothetical protein